MTKDLFIQLTITGKAEYLWKYGECISEKTYYHVNISLFRVENFLVEVFFNRVEEEIEGIAIQENDQILYEYVKDLELDEILK